MVVAKGSNETTNISGSRDYGSAGGHVDTNNRRMISHYGLEDCCGFMWQWVNDTFENYLVAGGNATTYKGSYYVEGHTYLDGYSWNDISVKNTTVYGDNSYGSARGLLRRAIVGGHWGDGSACGSRCVFCGYFPSYVYSAFGARGSSEPLITQ